MKLNDPKIKDLEYNEKKNKWYKRKNGKIIRTYFYKDSCKNCGEPFIGHKKALFCDSFCQNSGKNNPMYGKKRPDISGEKSPFSKKENREKLNQILNSNKNPSKRKDVRKKLSNKFKGENNPQYNGGYAKNNIPVYDIYANKISYVESVRRNKEDSNVLEIKCAYCGKWYIPTMSRIWNRIQSLEGTSGGECRFYCSDSCKEECPIFKRQKWPKGYKQATSREVQPELRQMVFKRDDYKCVKCGSNENLHCHHVEGIRWEPLESADMDKCITVCKTCHKEIHMKEDCRYNDLKCKEI
jgi:hypothetical protein